ncbi:hypothetical protein AGMMS50229_03580 [Campylobacterota bacterium]|nr:hypothetical protein AGMMS50229_03580 [Campylobacterota bacterium]
MREFLAAEDSTLEIAKTATLIKSLAINVLIIGERGTGKTMLANEILPATGSANGANEKEVEQLLLRSEALIIEDFDRISRPERFEAGSKRIVATVTKPIEQGVIDKFFGVTLKLPPLRERPKDVALLSVAFLNEAKETLMSSGDIDLNETALDLKDNAHSLRRSIFCALLLNDLQESDLMGITEKFLQKKLRDTSSVNIYRDYLHLFDRPLILAGLEEFGSQLKLSSVLGINRNTLRKKINELGIER